MAFECTLQLQLTTANCSLPIATVQSAHGESKGVVILGTTKPNMSVAVDKPYGQDLKKKIYADRHHKWGSLYSEAWGKYKHSPTAENI